MAFESAYFKNNNSFTFVFRFDDEEEAHFLMMGKRPLLCVPAFLVTQDCLLKGKENQNQEKKWHFLQDDVEIVAVFRCRLPRQDATEHSTECRVGLFSAVGSCLSAVSVMPKLWKLVGIFLFM